MRAVERGQFEKCELKTLDLLGRHAARALVISTHLAAARGIEGVLAAALAMFDSVAFVVDRACNVLFANKAAESLLGDGLTLNHAECVFQGAPRRLRGLHAIRAAQRGGPRRDRAPRAATAERALAADPPGHADCSG
jgi:hypothetical protein